MLSLKHTFKRKIFTKRFVNEYIQRNYAIKSESETIEVASNGKCENMKTGEGKMLNCIFL